MPARNTGREFKVLVMYWSATGNTEKVPSAIVKSLENENLKPVLKKISEAADEELYEYDLVFMGCPSYQFLPPKPVLEYVAQKMKFYGDRGDIKLGAPTRPEKYAVVFATYSGPHTGIREVTTVGEYLGQFFEHLGFDVLAKWYVAGERQGRPDSSTLGRLGDIRGRPNQLDLDEVEMNVTKLVKGLLHI